MDFLLRSSAWGSPDLFFDIIYLSPPTEIDT